MAAERERITRELSRLWARGVRVLVNEAKVGLTSKTHGLGAGVNSRGRVRAGATCPRGIIRARKARSSSG